MSTNKRLCLSDPSSVTPEASSTNKRLRLSDPSSVTPEASASSSSMPKRFKYDVFISFRGVDTRKTFVDHLYEALKDKGIYTYKDDERIEQGKTIDNQLIQAIRGSRCFIIVFSQNYASSSWCLDELVEIMECQKTGEQIAYPVFFDVEPTHVRYQSEAFGKAFLENRNKDAAGKWIEALKGASNLAGWELKATANGHEAKFINKIVQEISLELRSINFDFDEKLVGMETRVEDVVSSLEIGIDEVRIIGIKGMGGAGKTTLARAVFDHLSHHFEATSFVENVREASNGSDGLKKLQEQVLSDVLNGKVTVNGVFDGKNMMKRRMCSKKVLLVLDDVDHIEQLKALAGETNWFKPGSRILITTRDEQVLVAHRVDVICDIVLLSEKEAISLFSRYAFGRENPVQGYEELSGKVVRYAAGLPLTLEVLGSFLCGKDELEWVDAIDRLEKIPLKDTLEKLELSYISLEDDYKEIFLDIACILKGQTKEDAIRILESCGFNARIGLKVLEQRSLVTISSRYDGKLVLGMHDHIEELGKNIVRRLHPDEPNRHSRLWIDEEIKDILASDMGTEATRCLRLDMWRENSRILMNGLGKMKKLRYLEVLFAYTNNWKCDSKFDNTSQYFTNSLKYLKCERYPCLYLPKTFQANNLVGLEMKDSEMVQLWEEGEKKVLKKLKFLSLSSSKLRTFDLGLTPNLERLTLDNCADFEELHVSVACPNLKFLNLNKLRLRSLDLELIPNLEKLDLAVEINAPVGCLGKLDDLYLQGRRFINFTFCGRCEPKVNCSSATLYLDGKSLNSCPVHPNSNLPKLQFRCYYDENLPSSVGNIEKLFSFGLCACTDLKKVSDMICSLRCLEKLTLKGDIPEFPKDLGQLECLEELCLYSTKIKHLPDSICMLKCLKSLTVSSGNHFERLTEDLLEKLPEDLGQLECLEKLYLSSKKIEYLPDSICMLKRLKSLDLTGCCCLGMLPEDIGQLESLERLDLSSTVIKHLPDSICMLKHMKYLHLRFCHLLEKLPEDLGRLECLEHLDITYTGISHLPQSIFGLKGLLIAAPRELLQLYDFPSEIETTTSPILLETRVEDVVSSLEMGIDEVLMIGIRGMGGAGKTTTASAVFNHLSNDFEAKSFVEIVREVSYGSGLKKLQEQVLSDVLNEHVTLDSVDDGKDMMKKNLCSKKVLLVLDDVDHIEQLEALAGEPKWFKPGSRILITTRDKQVLIAHRVNVIRDIALLSEHEAIYLLSRYAFGREIPSQGYEELSRKAVRYAAGLPLAVKVLGSALCGKDKDDWEDAIDRLETLEQILELSFTSLDNDYKEIFLDIACILKGQTKEDAIRILESCGFHARNGLKVLEQRSLITVDDFGFLEMHDNIEEMGKNIVRCSRPYEPNEHSRLWINEEIEDILVEDMGTEETRCLKLKKSRVNAGIVMKGLGKMKNLRYLEVNFASYGPYQKKSDAECLDDTSQYFSNSLRYLKFKNYPFLYFPKTFQANNLVGLEMESSRMVQLWEEGEKKVLQKLRFLSFACPNPKFLNLSKSRLRSLDLEMIPNLERLDLAGCDELVEINVPIGGLKKLVHLYLSGCSLLEKLPEDIGRSERLEELDITYTDISHLPQSIFGLKGLIIAADQELLKLYDFPSEIDTTTDPIERR